MAQSSQASQKRILAIAAGLAIVFGAYFLRHFFSAVIFAAITAYLFNPAYNWFRGRVKRSSSAASLTMLIAALTFLIPATLIVIFTVVQISHLIDSLQQAHQISLSTFGNNVLDWINRLLAHLPGAHKVTTDQLNQTLHNAVSALAKNLLNLIASSAGSIGNFITAFIIFIYVFLSLLTNQERLIGNLRVLNPLGPAMTDTYLEKAGAMTSAMVRGQFVIAICQGLAEALILQIAGLHGLFFFLFVLLTILSIIPLGGGIVAIPIGIIMLLLGDIWQGLFVLLGHFVIVTNIDNVLRPYLVPKSVRLNPALTLLAVFSGIAMFGFLGIVIGPVIMIILKLTVEAYVVANTPKQKPTSLSRPAGRSRAASARTG